MVPRYFQWTEEASHKGTEEKRGASKRKAHTKSTKGHKEACSGDIARQATLLVIGEANPCTPPSFAVT
jgi:hypothetical protein